MCLSGSIVMDKKVLVINNLFDESSKRISWEKGGIHDQIKCLSTQIDKER